MAANCAVLIAATVLALCVASALANINWNGNNWALGCTFRGNDLAGVRIPSDQCGGRCAATKDCTHFVWTKDNGGNCWMKKGNIAKSNAIFTGDMSMVCGVVTQGGKTNGITTRYWDCCKPSCSWPGSVAPGNTKFVRACLRDGATTVTDPAGRSGCGGGPVYTCNDHQPWAVNDQLSYGFAAATIPGLNEQGRCCACYKLDFTSGPVTGKSMIVQVTNSGSDVHPNQFDLQIPGGGVGLFNGCSPQWGAGPDGWGKRYGGVSSRQECASLPKQLQSGCYWRFDWFKGAINPSMVYSRVRCPNEIVARSNCRRADD